MPVISASETTLLLCAGLAPAYEPPMPVSSQPRYPWVQVLRAAAAFAVALVHLANDAVVSGSDPAGIIARIAAAMPWEAGVDLFFVISGFVIVHASAGLFGRPGGWRVFLGRRLTRIAPLYWVVTTAFLALVVLARHTVNAQIGGPVYIAASYAFIPVARPDGLLQPPLGLGWTLNYEMFFYALLAVLIWLPRGRAVAAAAVVLAGLVAVARVLPPANDQLRFWSDPIVLEFVFGMGLALLAGREVVLPGWARLGLVVVAIVALHFAVGADHWRAFAYGVPGAMLVAAAVFGRPATHGVVMRGLVGLGDASYALYLCHPFAMRAFTVLGLHFLPRTEATGLAVMLLSLVAAEICAVAVHFGFERPVLRMLRPRRATDPARVSAAV